MQNGNQHYGATNGRPSYPPHSAAGGRQTNYAPRNHAQNSHGSEQRNPNSGESPKEFGAKLVAYGGKAAFQVSVSQTKDGKETINIESANKLNPNDRNDRKLDWENKLIFQLTLNELPVFIAVLYGFIPAARFDLHGSCNSKFFEVINQNDKYFFKSGAQDVQMKVAPVSLSDATHFGMVALGAYAKNFPGLSSDSVMVGLKILIKRLCETKAIKQPQQR